MSGLPSSKVGSMHSGEAVDDDKQQVTSAHSSKPHSGRQVHFQESHTHEKAEQSAVDGMHSRGSTPDEKAEVHKVYNDLSMWRKQYLLY